MSATGEFTGINGDPLTLAEVKAIQALTRVADRWPGTLRLVSADGHLHVIHAGDERFIDSMLEVRRSAVLYSFGIPNDAESDRTLGEAVTSARNPLVPPARPPAAEWSGDKDDLPFPDGTPLLRSGRLQAGTRDASSVARPDTRTSKARHVVVASSGALAAACDSQRIMICASPMIPAAEVSPAGRCRRPGCARLFAQAAASAGRRKS